jgi:hypothetical protein
VDWKRYYVVCLSMKMDDKKWCGYVCVNTITIRRRIYFELPKLIALLRFEVLKGLCKTRVTSLFTSHEMETKNSHNMGYLVKTGIARNFLISIEDFVREPRTRIIDNHEYVSLVP